MAATTTVQPAANVTTGVQPKPARRVLPEHEGRYKITLPSGTTKRSKEILAKKAMRKIQHIMCVCTFCL